MIYHKKSIIFSILYISILLINRTDGKECFDMHSYTVAKCSKECQGTIGLTKTNKQSTFSSFKCQNEYKKYKEASPDKMDKVIYNTRRLRMNTDKVHKHDYKHSNSTNKSYNITKNKYYKKSNVTCNLNKTITIHYYQNITVNRRNDSNITHYNNTNSTNSIYNKTTYNRKLVGMYNNITSNELYNNSNLSNYLTANGTWNGHLNKTINRRKCCNKCHNNNNYNKTTNTRNVTGQSYNITRKRHYKKFNYYRYLNKTTIFNDNLNKSVNCRNCCNESYSNNINIGYSNTTTNNFTVIGNYYNMTSKENDKNSSSSIHLNNNTLFNHSLNIPINSRNDYNMSNYNATSNNYNKTTNLNTTGNYYNLTSNGYFEHSNLSDCLNNNITLSRTLNNDSESFLENNI